MKVKKLVNAYLEHARNQNRKPSTLRHYEGRLKPFRKRCGHLKLKDVTPEVIEKYLKWANHWRDGKPKAQDTRRSTVILIEQLFRFALRMRWIKKLPFERLEKPPSRKRDRVPTEAEDTAIEQLASPAFLKLFTALRRTGARPGEMINAQVTDYQADRKLIVLRDHKTAAKVGKPRLIGIGDKLAPVLADAIAGRESGAIFLDEKSQPWTVQKASRTYRTLRDKAGLSKDLVLYSQRHSVGTRITRNCGIAQATQVLGHTSTVTTMRYNHPDDSETPQHLDTIQ